VAAPGWAAAAAVRWDGVERVEQALGAGRGLLLLTPHLGCFEVAAQAAAERFGASAPITVLYRPARKPWLRELVDGARRDRGLRTAPATLAGVRQMMRALRPGRSSACCPTRCRPTGMGVWAPFFGRPAYTMTLAARLLQQTGAPVLCWCERLPGAGIRVHVRAFQEAAARAGRRPRPRPARVNRAMEALIREAPRSTCGATPLQGAAARRRPPAMPGRIGARAAIALLWLLHWLPLPLAGGPGAGLGRAAVVAGRVAPRMWRCAISSCAFPSWTSRSAGRWRASTSAGWAAPSWSAACSGSPVRARLQRLIRVEGDLLQAERSERP
jgi:lauroyl/myristoyl acyltransferase